LGGRFHFGKNLSVSAAINAEQRGFSDGVSSHRTRNFYPYFNASYSNRIGKFSYLIQAGDFWDFKLYEGLTFSNLETQSWIFKLKYGKFYVKHAGVGDLLIGIGLGIDDLYDYSAGFEEVHLSQDSSLTMDIRVGRSNNRGSIGGAFCNASTRLYHKEKGTLYAQVSIQDDSDAAFLVGVERDFAISERLSISGKAEFRRYGFGFNTGYENDVYYRDPQEPASFVNSTHTVFVPLDYYERNFNQWALYTEYQGLDINSVSIIAKVKYKLTNSLSAALSMDALWLDDPFQTTLYPFYRIGLVAEPWPQTEVSLEIVNKVLNLDKNYPTFYATTSPYLLMRLYKPLKFRRENDSKHRQ